MLTRTTTVAATIGLTLALAASTAWANTPAPANKSDRPQSAAKKAAAAAPTTAAAAGSQAQRGRDWTKIDTNGDNLISPEEMEKWLAANPGPQR
jgi:hypothetical protein